MNSKETYSSKTFILLQDLSLSLFGSLLAMLVARWIADPIPSFTALTLKWLVFSLIASFSGVILAGSHKVVRKYFSRQSVMKIVYALAIKEALLTIVLLTHLIDLSSPARSLVLILTDLFFTLFFVIYIRYAFEVFSHSTESVKDNAMKKTALVSGVGDAAIALAEEAQKKQGYDVVGFISRNPQMGGRLIGSRLVYYISNDEDLAALMWRLGGVDCILFTKEEAVIPNNGIAGAETSIHGTSKTEASKTETTSNGATSHDTSNGGTLSGESRLSDSGRALEEREIPKVQDGMNQVGHIIKRTFDVVLSSVLLIIFSPLIAICAIAIKLEDGDPVIFSQERIGLDGKPFNIYKFRSMRIDAESDGPALYTENDSRLTKVGKFLREHHLDELPQLWNVLKGDMSFIGYRPERKCYIDRSVERNPRYMCLYQIRPGVTSFATLYNGYTDTLAKMLTRLDLDLYYLRNHSVWFDMKVLGLTFLSIMTGKKF